MLIRPIGCDKCVLPEGYAGASFEATRERKLCNFCSEFKKPEFLGEEALVKDLALTGNEQVGVTVSGGKDSLNVWLWLVKKFGPDRVVAFNHRKVDLIHPLTDVNLGRAQENLGSELIQVEDREMFPRFKQNLSALLSVPDAAMVRVALCAGCRVGISGRLFEKAEKFGITKMLNGSSYLEDAPFKAALMRMKGNGSEMKGLKIGLQENPLYNFPGNIEVIKVDNEHRHTTDLSGERSKRLYPHMTYLDFYKYIPNIPADIERRVMTELDWQKPKEQSWHFDCLVEPFKDLLYYGLLGYTETDYKLSAMVRYGLIPREDALIRLEEERQRIVGSTEYVFSLMEEMDLAKLIPQLKNFIHQSPYLSSNKRVK